MTANSGLNYPGIYTIKCIPTGKIYVGQTINLRRRWHSHRWHLRKGIHKNGHLQNAWNKYGEDNFVFYIVIDLQGTPSDQLQAALNEAELRILGTIPKAFNLMEAARGGTIPGASTRAKLSAQRKLLWQDPEFRARRAASLKAAVETKEWKDRHAEIARERSMDEAFREKMSAVNKKNWENADQRRKARGELEHKLWKDPAYREKQAKARATAWANTPPEDRQRRIDNAQEAKARNRAARLAKDQNAT